ncbi:hypothetical protein A1Q2_03488 [Trichosporon asahii var. asahii CBS 8904]|uniref:Uncharacterized protein n=1 Tax=Trichosporon asahii var. asahii (strain CBS 8904) TaxID=1220162 RepID=K1VNB0_TRIAC|nr:hypothetical protein A1Q2_03488 [Trichosporon asahii var. asahii CBS 8904]
MNVCPPSVDPWNSPELSSSATVQCDHYPGQALHTDAAHDYPRRPCEQAAGKRVSPWTRAAISISVSDRLRAPTAVRSTYRARCGHAAIIVGPGLPNSDSSAASVRGPPSAIDRHSPPYPHPQAPPFVPSVLALLRTAPPILLPGATPQVWTGSTPLAWQ